MVYKQKEVNDSSRVRDIFEMYLKVRIYEIENWGYGGVWIAFQDRGTSNLKA